VHHQEKSVLGNHSPTKLYSQHYFPSLDFTLSFHIGVMARVIALQRGAPNDPTNRGSLSLGGGGNNQL
jgi:hypothetical protein